MNQSGPVATTNDLTLLAQLGTGGMADVFLAMRRGFGGFAKLVVVKRLRPSADHDVAAMFVDEARLAGRLNHPNVVQTFHCENGELEMEYLDGQTLHRILRRAKKAGRALDAGFAMLVIRDILAGLHYAHELEDFDGSPLHIVHRDVSPQNVFVTYDGEVKLIDFGIAKTADQSQVTQVGIVKGKTRFMAPEQARGWFIDRRVDIFATGILMWELLTGERYWGKGSETDVLRRLTSGDLPPAPASVNPEIDPELSRICARALAFEASDRYADAAAFLADLEPAMPSQGNAAQRGGELVAELFAEDQRTLRAVIEKALARGQVGKVHASDLTTLSTSGTHSRADFTEEPVILRTQPPAPVLPVRTPQRGLLGLAAIAVACASMMIGFRLTSGPGRSSTEASHASHASSTVPSSKIAPSSTTMTIPTATATLEAATDAGGASRTSNVPSSTAVTLPAARPASRPAAVASAIPVTPADAGGAAEMAEPTPTTAESQLRSP
jgi:eukaryotic-like serine/threonine-protein kinase